MKLLIILISLFLILNFVFAQDYSIEIYNNEPYQGDILIVRLLLPNNFKINKASLGEDQVNFVLINENEYISFIGINAKQAPGNYQLIVHLNNNQKIERNIEIKKRNFPITVLKTTPELEKKGFTPPQIIKNLEKENKIVNEATSKFTNKTYFKEKFIYPLRKISIVGDYGNIRVSGSNKVQHLGIDLDGKIDDEVYAINDGIVVLAKDLINYGKTIIINHGGGIYSLYLHLNKFFVKENEYVKRCQKIGEVGNTGYSLEPHLHLSIKVNNQSIDPLRFISSINKFLDSTSKDKEVFKNKLKNNNIKLNQNKGSFQANIYNLAKNISWGFEKSDNRKIDTIIIHSSYNSLDQDYYNIDKIINIYKNYNVSPHYLIDRQGNIYKLLDEENIAYHAGKSKMPDSRTGVNYFSIGIEIIYHKNESPNDFQYQALNNLIKNIKTRYKIKYILGHKDIAPDRKDDPWNFDWNKVEK